MRPFNLFFLTFNMDRWTDQLAYLPIEMQFYIPVMFLGFPNIMKYTKKTLQIVFVLLPPKVKKNKCVTDR